MRLCLIVDLGFGDAGKGLLTDFLARQLKAGLVVRYNGGAQAGHNVVDPSGRHHTFSQFGSGTFVPGVRTFLSRHVVIHPTAFLVEGDALRLKGVRDAFERVRISGNCLVITPYHQAANRLRELLRGPARHGSCGVGVGEAVDDARLHPEDAVHASDLADLTSLRRKVERVREAKLSEMESLCSSVSLTPSISAELSIMKHPQLIDSWLERIERFNRLDLVAPDSLLERWLQEAGTAVFEGAQGALLDADAGFHPYATWSNCTLANASELVREMAPGAEVHRFGVIRSHAVRHGPGPLPTASEELAALITEHNTFGEWQGPVRYGWFDAVLARYALDLVGGVDCLILTHMDLLGRLQDWKYCPAYPENIDLPGPRIVASLPLEQRSRLTKTLLDLKPHLESRPAVEPQVIRQVEFLLAHPVDLVSRGPTAADIETLTSLP